MKNTNRRLFIKNSSITSITASTLGLGSFAYASAGNTKNVVHILRMHAVIPGQTVVVPFSGHGRTPQLAETRAFVDLQKGLMSC